MNFRLAGIKPLVGVDLHHSFIGADAKPMAPCETCDKCGQQVLARNIYFDGERFLCTTCRQNAKPNQA